MLFLLLMQAAVQQAPDIQFNARVRARSVTIEKQGNASLTVRTEPEGNNVVDIRAPKANGRKTLPNVEATVNVEARIGDPKQVPEDNREQPETTPPE